MPDTVDSDLGGCASTPPPETAVNSKASAKRPEGVWVVAEMEMLGGAVLLVLAGTLTGIAVAIQSGGALGDIISMSYGLDWLREAVQSVIEALFYLVCVVACALYCLAALLLVDRHGLLVGRPWAQGLAIHLSILFIALGAAPLIYTILSRIIPQLGRIKVPSTAVVAGLIVAVVGVVVLWYLREPHIKQYFGETHLD